MGDEKQRETHADHDPGGEQAEEQNNNGAE